MLPSVSVIVVTYNSSAVLADCLSSISRHLISPEIVVVDNGSSDDTVDIATSHPGTRVVEGQVNIGFGAGVNVGAKAATQPLLLVMNPDATVLAVNGASFESLTDAPTVGVRACRRDGPRRDRYPIFPAWSWRAELNWWMFAWFVLPKELSMRRPRARAGRARWISGAAFVVRREEFLSLGGFDERFFLYLEDFDLSRSYRMHGLPVETTDAFVVSHAHAQSSPRDENLMIAYVLLGLIEYAAKVDQVRGAQSAASRCIRLLRGIAKTGRALRAFPIVGARAEKKRVSAEGVLQMLGASIDTVPPGVYNSAGEAIAAVMRCGSCEPSRPSSGRYR
jgi:GT2 family glycosyltransferase